MPSKIDGDRQHRFPSRFSNGTSATAGSAGALIYPTTLSVTNNAFADRGDRAKAIGLWGAVTGLGVPPGPVTGDLLLAHCSWPSVFVAPVPVAVLGAALTFCS